MVIALWLKRQLNDNKVRVVVSQLFVALMACFTLNLYIIAVNKCSVTKILLTNVTKMNKQISILQDLIMP